jgi:hypothetical protein
MKLYSTTDIAVSLRKASEAFTHVVFNRGHTMAKYVPFDTSTIPDLPVYQYKVNIPESHSQLVRWRERGGILITLDTHVSVEGGQDVTVMIECPYNMQRLEKCNEANAEYGVIPNPMTWTAYDEEIDLRHPQVNYLQDLWFHCGGRQMTNSELAESSGWPVRQVQSMKNVLKPDEHWYIQKRLAPEREEFIPAWDWLESGCMPKSAVTNAGFRPQVEEMARFGYIGLKRLQHYPSETPNWRKLQKDRDAALKSLSDVRSLVDSLPDHLTE